jgi:hypothetical protein
MDSLHEEIPYVKSLKRRGSDLADELYQQLPEAA